MSEHKTTDVVARLRTAINADADDGEPPSRIAEMLAAAAEIERLRVALLDAEQRLALAEMANEARRLNLE